MVLDENLLWDITNYLARDALVFRLVFKGVDFLDKVSSIVNWRKHDQYDEAYTKELVMLSGVLRIFRGGVLSVYLWHQDILTVEQVVKFYAFCGHRLDGTEHGKYINNDLYLNFLSLSDDYLECRNALISGRVSEIIILLVNQDCTKELLPYLLDAIEDGCAYGISHSLQYYRTKVSPEKYNSLIEKIIEKIGTCSQKIPYTDDEIKARWYSGNADDALFRVLWKKLTNPYVVNIKKKIVKFPLAKCKNSKQLLYEYRSGNTWNTFTSDCQNGPDRYTVHRRMYNLSYRPYYGSRVKAKELDTIKNGFDDESYLLRNIIEILNKNYLLGNRYNDDSIELERKISYIKRLTSLAPSDLNYCKKVLKYLADNNFSDTAQKIYDVFKDMKHGLSQ